MKNSVFQIVTMENFEALTCHKRSRMFCFFDITNIPFVLSRVHMTRFAYVCKFCIYAKFAYVRKSGHVYAFTHVCKICTYAKVEKFAPASDQVQISFCVYAKFAYMQIWSCEQKAKFAHVSIYLIVLNNC